MPNINLCPQVPYPHIFEYFQDGKCLSLFNSKNKCSFILINIQEDFFSYPRTSNNVEYVLQWWFFKNLSFKGLTPAEVYWNLKNSILFFNQIIAFIIFIEYFYSKALVDKSMV